MTVKELIAQLGKLEHLDAQVLTTGYRLHQIMAVSPTPSDRCLGYGTKSTKYYLLVTDA